MQVSFFPVRLIEMSVLFFDISCYLLLLFILTSLIASYCLLLFRVVMLSPVLPWLLGKETSQRLHLIKFGLLCKIKTWQQRLTPSRHEHLDSDDASCA